MPEASSTALKLWVVMNRAVRSIEARLRRQVEAWGLSYTEFAVLEVLLHKGTLPIGEIGGRILLASGSMTYVVDKLEQRGLLRRRASEADRRVIRAELTDAGRDLIARVFAEHERLLADLLAPLDADEQRAAADLVKRVGLHAAAEDAAAQNAA